MKVIFVAYVCCIRTIKEAIALSSKGVDVIVIMHSCANPEMTRYLPDIYYYTNAEERKELLSVHSVGADLIHVHFQPDRLATEAKSMRPDLPVVLDAHDLNSVRTEKVYQDETYAFEKADGFIFPSESYERYARNAYGLEDYTQVIYSMVNERFVPKDLPSETNGIVYQGGITTAPISDSPGTIEGAKRRDHRHIAEKIVDMGIPFTIYTTKQHSIYADEYKYTGAIIHEGTDYLQLMQELTHYSWGLFGNGVKSLQQDWAMPNKLFEYISAGVPPLIIDSAEMGDWVEHVGIGVHVKSIEDIPSVMSRHAECKEKLLSMRNDFTMENQTVYILQLYRELLNG